MIWTTVVLFLITVETFQNWSHVRTVVEHLNRLPSTQPRTDVMRIRPWYILFAFFLMFPTPSLINIKFVCLLSIVVFISFNFAYGKIIVTY